MSKYIRILIFVTLLFTGIVATPGQSVSAHEPNPPVEGVPMLKEAPSPNGILIPAPSPSMLQLPELSAEPLAVEADGTTIISNPLLDMKVLVVYDSNMQTGVFAMMLAYLDILGVPYDVIDTQTHAITENDLWDGNRRGHYYAIFFELGLTYWGDPWGTNPRPLTQAERDVITTYQRNFGVRDVIWYEIPIWAPPRSGLTNGGVLVVTDPLTATFTAEGQEVFSYLRPDLELHKAAGDYAYPGTITIDPSLGEEVVPLLTDNNGKVTVSVYRSGNGVERLVFTWPSYYPAMPPSNIYARLLPYGIINWATKGVFLGQRHVYFVPQPDDVFAWGDRWNAETHEYDMDYGYRLEPSDMDNVVAWMNDLRANTPNAADFKMEMPFNGEGTEQDRVQNPDGTLGAPMPGTLTARAVELHNEFIWLNHTYTHADLYETTYQENVAEIWQNTQLARDLGLSDYTRRTLLTGAYSGITNTALINAAYGQGVRYLMVNASYPDYRSPTPNTGIPHPDDPRVLQLPRYANNIFYAVTNPAEETDLYNVIYGTNYDYETIIDRITDQSLGDLLDFNVNPTMFHMNNLDQYGNGSNTVLGDFVESLYGKYNAYYNANVPILSLSTQQIGRLMQERMAYNASNVQGVVNCGNTITLHAPDGAVRVPVTGVQYGRNTEVYADQPISYFRIRAGRTIRIRGERAERPAPITGLTLTASGDDNVLTWDPTTTSTTGAPLSALIYRVYRSTSSRFRLNSGTLIADNLVEPTYTDPGAASGTYYYAVVAIGDNCWKLPSRASRVSTGTASTFDLIDDGGSSIDVDVYDDNRTVIEQYDLP